MKYDSYGEVVNSPETYQSICNFLVDGGRVMIGWSDGKGSHFDILFAVQVPVFGGQIQGGIRPGTDLLVSIMRKGAFGFEIEESPDTVAGYYNEKLGVNSEELTQLINAVRHEFYSYCSHS